MVETRTPDDATQELSAPPTYLKHLVATGLRVIRVGFFVWHGDEKEITPHYLLEVALGWALPGRGDVVHFRDEAAFYRVRDIVFEYASAKTDDERYINHHIIVILQAYEKA